MQWPPCWRSVGDGERRRHRHCLPRSPSLSFSFFSPDDSAICSGRGTPGSTALAWLCGCGGRGTTRATATRTRLVARSSGAALSFFFSFSFFVFFSSLMVPVAVGRCAATQWLGSRSSSATMALLGEAVRQRDAGTAGGTLALQPCRRSVWRDLCVTSVDSRPWCRMRGLATMARRRLMHAGGQLNSCRRPGENGKKRDGWKHDGQWLVS